MGIIIILNLSKPLLTDFHNYKASNFIEDDLHILKIMM